MDVVVDAVWGDAVVDVVGAGWVVVTGGSETTGLPIPDTLRIVRYGARTG